MTALLGALRTTVDRIPPILRDFLLACGLVSAACAFAYVLNAFGDRRLSMIFLLPVLFSGFVGGLRAAIIAAALTYLVYDLFVIPPIFTLFSATAEDTIALVVFASAAVVTGLGSGALREEQRRAAERSRTILTLLETNNFFAITPNEAAIRQRLVDGVTAISGTGAVFMDADGTVTHRAGLGEDWLGGLEGELSNLGRLAMRHERAGAAARGRFRARAARDHAGSLGAAVWLGPLARSRGVRERDEHIAMLVELASAALARSRREPQA